MSATMRTETIDREALAEMAALGQRLVEEIGRAVFGARQGIEIILTSLLARGHVLLEGVPGVAKTTLAKSVAQTLGCSFRRIQFTPDLLPGDITGTFVLDPAKGSFSLRQGPIFAQLILADEINRAPAKTQSALLEAMQERQVTIEGETRELAPPFMVLATQNPIEHAGTYPLPEAQVDRFLARVRVGYPPLAEERAMLRRHSGGARPLEEIRRLLDPQAITRAQALVDEVHIDDELLDYVLRIAQATRSHRRVVLGASPRGALQLVGAAKARALLSGRDFVLPDDIKQLSPFVLAHRIVMGPDAELEGVRAETVVEEILGRTPIRPDGRS